MRKRLSNKALSTTIGMPSAFEILHASLKKCYFASCCRDKTLVPGLGFFRATDAHLSTGEPVARFIAMNEYVSKF